jgi:serine protease Do
MSFYDKVRGQKFLSFTLMVFTLAAGILIGTIAQTGAKAAKEQAAAPDATPLTIPKAVVIENEFTKVAKTLEPSVVNIETEYIPKTNVQTRNTPPNTRRRQQQQEPDDQGDDNGGGLPDLFQRFFGQGGGGGGLQFGQPQDQRSASLGSGVVVDPNGYILTNNHVVENATRIKVKFHNDSTEYPATVIGTDPQTDLAVIHVGRKGLPAAKIGNSDAIQPGDWAIAIGSPFSFESTVTAGIVSAVSRDLGQQDSTSFQHFIQTDAAINPGNSGGPLANINGEVIGINTMIASRSGGYQGIGFAMPINTAVKVYNSIIKAGHVTRGSVGIKFEEANSDLLKVYGASHGVFVREITPGGPADKANVKPEDIISSINGKPINKGQDLIDMVADSDVGSTLKLGVIRDKKTLTLDIVVGDRDKVFSELAQNGAGAPGGTTEGGAQQLKFGMSVQALRSAERQAMNFKGANGVLIASTEPGMFADDIGLEKGDVIVELNRQPVNSPEDIRRIQNTLKPGDPVAFHVMRQAQQRVGGNGEWQSLFLAGSVPANQ